jgi:hypothetical protein
MCVSCGADPRAYNLPIRLRVAQEAPDGVSRLAALAHAAEASPAGLSRPDAAGGEPIHQHLMMRLRHGITPKQGKGAVEKYSGHLPHGT